MRITPCGAVGWTQTREGSRYIRPVHDWKILRAFGLCVHAGVGVAPVRNAIVGGRRHYRMHGDSSSHGRWRELEILDYPEVGQALQGVHHAGSPNGRVALLLAKNRQCRERVVLGPGQQSGIFKLAGQSGLRWRPGFRCQVHQAIALRIFAGVGAAEARSPGTLGGMGNCVPGLCS